MAKEKRYFFTVTEEMITNKGTAPIPYCVPGIGGKPDLMI